MSLSPSPSSLHALLIKVSCSPLYTISLMRARAQNTCICMCVISLCFNISMLWKCAKLYSRLRYSSIGQDCRLMPECFVGDGGNQTLRPCYHCAPKCPQIDQSIFIWESANQCVGFKPTQQRHVVQAGAVARTILAWFIHIGWNLVYFYILHTLFFIYKKAHYQLCLPCLSCLYSYLNLLSCYLNVHTCCMPAKMSVTVAAATKLSYVFSFFSVLYVPKVSLSLPV